MKPKVYIAGPYSKGDVAINVRNAFEVGNSLADRGFAPYIPHYTHFWHMFYPHSYQFWLDLDMEFLIGCDALYRIAGDSEGADKEVQFAINNSIPCFYSINEIIDYFKTKL